MDAIFPQRLGICAYLDRDWQDEKRIRELRRWIDWHRRRGVSFFYLYVSFDTAGLRRGLAAEVNNGLALLLQISGGSGEQIYLSACNDCLKRTRYVCEHVAFLQAGEYLVTAGQGSLPEAIEVQFAKQCAALYMQTARGIRCMVNPLAVRSFSNASTLDAYDGWYAKPAEGISVTDHAPGKGRIALLSHVLARNGAPLALLSVARILKEAGYELDIFSVVPGQLAGEFEALGLQVHIDPSLHGTALADQTWYEVYDLVFANTAVMSGCFRKALKHAPAIWWLHESPISLKLCRISKESLAVLENRNIITYGVSQAAQNAFLALRPDWRMAGNLVLGVRDEHPGRKKMRKGKSSRLVFLMVGTVEHNKGQDIMLEAISRLEAGERERCEFWLVGGKNILDKSDFFEQVAAKAAMYPEVKLMDFQPHNKLMELYARAAAFVVPSREECLPTVAIEAMMMGVPCILADKLGVSYYVTDEKNALLFENGSPGSLAERLHQVICDKAALSEIGRKGRLLYEKEFAMEIFRGKLLKAVQDCMGN